MAEPTQKPVFSSAVVLPTVQAATQILAEVQQSQVESNRPPLPGVEAAAEVAKKLPKQPPAGQKYRIGEIRKMTPGEPMDDSNSSVIRSDDGTVEDAVRRYNASHKSSLTFRQLRVELVGKAA